MRTATLSIVVCAIDTSKPARSRHAAERLGPDGEAFVGALQLDDQLQFLAEAEQAAGKDVANPEK